jgi:acetate kinase
MKILVLNSGSSSIKFQLIEMPAGEMICTGLVERIGLPDAQLHFKTAEGTFSETLDIPDHQTGLAAAAKWLMDEDKGVIKSRDEVEVVGHRVVHGGSSFSQTSEITEEVKKEIKKISSLAPLHNPANLAGIEVAEQVFNKARQVAVFDTAFHQTIPEKAHRYAIPETLYSEEHIRLYGFHGTSHKYVSEKAKEYLDTNATKMITLHLGNGCSATAVKDGKSIDHSLGFGPMTGLLMGTRSGDIDPALIFYLVDQLGYSLKDVETLLQKKSGLLALTGQSDLRDIDEKARAGDTACQLALDLMTYRIKKYIGAYAAAMNGLHAIVFTGGIGENSVTVRKMVCAEMDVLGIEMDLQLNTTRAHKLLEVNAAASKVKILVIPTNEELEIAKQSFELCGWDA